MQPQRFITAGIQNRLPAWLVFLLWAMADGIDVQEKDYLQIFRLSRTEIGQHIVHEQEQPPYRQELDVPCAGAVETKVYVIDDQTHSTMLLADEY